MIKIKTQQRDDNITESDITLDVETFMDAGIESVALICALFHRLKEIDEGLHDDTLKVTIRLLTEMAHGKTPIPTKFMGEEERLN